MSEDGHLLFESGAMLMRPAKRYKAGGKRSCVVLLQRELSCVLDAIFDGCCARTEVRTRGQVEVGSWCTEFKG